MVKFIITLAFSMLLTQSAFASKARLISLGESKDGSLYVDDMANIFNNSAYIHNHTNKMTLEWGNNAGNFVGLDTNTAPKAQGGFLKSCENYVYGLYLGNESDTTQLLRLSGAGADPTLGSTSKTLIQTDNAFDLFLGGGDELKWSVNLSYTHSKDESGVKGVREETSYGTRLGMIMGDMEAYLNVSAKRDAKDTSNDLKFEGKLGYHIGGAYDVGNWKPFLSYKTGDWEVNESGVNREASFSVLEFGTGHTMSMGNGQNLFTRINFFREEVKLDASAGNVEGKIMRVPLVIGYEAHANEWLTFRGSITNNIIGKRESKNLSSVINASAQAVYVARYNGAGASSADKKETIANSTDVTAGASLNFGALKIDGVIGVNDITGSRTNADSEKGVLDLDRLLTRVAMTYSF